MFCIILRTILICMILILLDNENFLAEFLETLFCLQMGSYFGYTVATTDINSDG